MDVKPRRGRPTSGETRVLLHPEDSSLQGLVEVQAVVQIVHQHRSVETGDLW